MAGKTRSEYVSMFVPVYNEEIILVKNILEIKKTLSSITKDFQIYIVDDNSNDKTPEVADKLAAKDPHITHLRYDFGPSRRENLAKSFYKGKGEIIAFMDLDLATDLRDTYRLIEEIENGADIAIGSRYVSGSKRDRRLFRHVVSIIFNHTVKIIFGSRINDHECGFKSFKKSVILDLLSELGYDKTLKRGVFWDSEMLVVAQHKNYRIKEFPIEWFERQKSALNVKREKDMIPYIIRLKGKYIRQYFSK